MEHSISTHGVRSFYRAALAGLRWLEIVEPTGRRFGPEADARWKGFAGHLTLTDRIDLLLRDAAVVWGAAFSAASVFQLPGLAADEPFGPDWPRTPEESVRGLWKETLEIEPSSWDRAWELLLEAWKLDSSSLHFIGWL